MRAVTDLTAARTPEGIELIWRAPADQADIVGYAVYSSRSTLSEAPCPECPVEFEKIGTVAEDDHSGRDRIYRFISNAGPGHRYQLKVTPYLTTGARGPDSNVVRIEYQQTDDQR